MADLNVQPRKRTPVWPWIFLLLIIAAVAYFVLRDKNVIPEGTTSDSTTMQRADTATQYPADTTMQLRTDTVSTDTSAR